jgi:hypothetical protein
MKLNHFALILCTSLALGGCVDDPAEVTTTAAAKATCTSTLVVPANATMPTPVNWTGALPPPTGGTLTYVLLPLTGQNAGYWYLFQVDLTAAKVNATRKLTSAQQPDAVKLLSGSGLTYAVIRVPPPVGPGGTDWTTVKRWVTYADSVFSVP